MCKKYITEIVTGQREFIPCPNVVGVFSGYREGGTSGGQFVSGCIPCGSWSCPSCGPRKKRVLYKRYLEGGISQKTLSVYGRKFLTLTAPGAYWRSQNNPEQAYKILADHFSHMIRNLRKKYGHFDFIRVAEAQRDGQPHFHVLLVGDSISSKEILHDIEHLWREVYCMGFVKLNKVSFKNGGHALNYILKYITKDVRGFGRYKRIFTVSQGALAKVEKIKWDSCKVVMGRVDDTGVHSFAMTSEMFTDLVTGFQPYSNDYKTLESVFDQLLTVFMGSNISTM